MAVTKSANASEIVNLGNYYELHVNTDKQSNPFMGDYFPDLYVANNVYREKIDERCVRRSTGSLFFTVGDISNVSYVNKYITYGFEGICICLRRKRMLDSNLTVILRNILANVGVELTMSYFYARLYRLRLSDHKRKRFYYRRAKLYYIRRNLNRGSRIN